MQARALTLRSALEEDPIENLPPSDVEACLAYYLQQRGHASLPMLQVSRGCWGRC